MTATVGLGEPPDRDEVLCTFPEHELDQEVTLYRICRRANGTWWFSSTGEGRFDIGVDGAPDDVGTCYLAREPASAVLEVFRSWPVLASDIAGRELRRVHVPLTHLLADTTSRDARSFGITKEVSTLVPYDRTQRWAAAWHRAGFEGVLHELRHDPAAVASGVSVFGPGGAQDDTYGRGGATDIGEDLVTAAGLKVLPAPTSSSLHVAADVQAPVETRTDPAPE